MCGIYGMVSTSGAPLRHPDLLAKMGQAVKHRGPDHTGEMVFPHAALGVNRLRIVDLDPRSDQPLVDPEHCVSVALNGEIYNAPELRRAFPDYRFRTRSDVEVVLPLYLEKGRAGFAELSGMFAAAIWDDGARRLLLSRDRAGEKPLFYAVIGEEVWFASEIQALLLHPELSRTLDHDALDDVLALGYVREPRTMFSAIRKVCAGTTLVFEAVGTSIEARAADDDATPGSSDSAGWIRELEGLLETAVRRQVAADVPVGVFLSGGLDSSLLASIVAQETRPAQLRTFSVRFDEPSYDEGVAARAIATRLGTSHVEVTATPSRLREAYDTVFASVAEPLADPAILPTYLLARAARQEVGVVLSGEGADELFGGYPTYLGHRLAPVIARAPARFRGWLAARLPRSAGSVPTSDLLGRLLNHADRPWLERHLAWFGTGLADRALVARPDAARATDRWSGSPRTSGDVLRDVMRFDYETYLRDGLLPKIDRATMLVALEARAPYLDREVTRFAFLPAGLKVRGFTTKWLLKQAARRWLPSQVIQRRKHGLSVPISGLINGELRGETERLLAPERLRRQGLFNAGAAGQLLSEHRAGNFRLARAVWTLVVLQRWLEEWT